MPTTTAALLIVTLLTVAVTTASNSDCIVDKTLHRSLIEENEDLVHCVTSKYTENSEGCTIDQLQEGFARTDAIETAQCLIEDRGSSIACYCTDKCTEEELTDLLGALEEEDPYLEVSCVENFLASWRNSRSPNLPDETQTKSQNTLAHETTALSSIEGSKEETTYSAIVGEPSSTKTKPKKSTHASTLFDELRSPSTRDIHVPGIPTSAITTSARTKTSLTQRSTQKRTSKGKTRSTESTAATRSVPSTTRPTSMSRTSESKSNFSVTRRGFSTGPERTSTTTGIFSTQEKQEVTNGTTTKTSGGNAIPEPNQPGSESRFANQTSMDKQEAYSFAKKQLQKAVTFKLLWVTSVMTFLMICQMVMISFVRYETMYYILSSTSSSSESSKLEGQRTNSPSSASKTFLPYNPNGNNNKAPPKVLPKEPPRALPKSLALKLKRLAPKR